MDLNEQDRASLNAKICPDCGSSIEIYLFEATRPLCKKCDVWFEFDNSGWVIRNLDAGSIYRQEWENKWNEVLQA
jgi:hypothetical protein